MDSGEAGTTPIDVMPEFLLLGMKLRQVANFRASKEEMMKATSITSRLVIVNDGSYWPNDHTSKQSTCAHE